MAISYQIKVIPAQHIFDVKLSFVASAASQLLKLPVWIPGSYMVREFSRQIISVVANQTGASVFCEQLNKNSWQLKGLTIGEYVEIYYQVYAYEYGIRTAFLDTNRGYFNPSSICLAVSGCENSRHSIKFDTLPNNWQVASGLEQTAPGTFIAGDYDELIDCPFEIGDFTRISFQVANLPHYLILSGTIPPFDRERMIKEISQICEYQIQLFGGTAPYNVYTFILNLSGEIYTGLEHRNSTLLMAPFYSLPNLSRSNDEDYHKLMGLISHEFFHTWNVKRIKPKAFTPYDLDQENYTKLLWWFEGVTSYYDDLVLYRANVISREKYLGLIVENLNNVYKFAGVTRQTLANSSLTSWIKYYRQDENSPNILVSYYVKGALIALCLDLFLREKSNFSLDSVMRYLFNEWSKNPVGIDEDELPGLIEAATGVNLHEFIHQATQTCEMLPYQELFAKFGLVLSERSAANHQDKGKYYPAPKPTDEKKPVLDLGCKLEKASLGFVVKNVYAGGCAEKAGLAAGDNLLAINNIKLTNLDRQLAFFSTGDKVNLSLFRQDKLLVLPLDLDYSVAKVFDLTLEDVSRLGKWL